MAWVRSVVGDAEHPLVELNDFAWRMGSTGLLLPRFDPAFLALLGLESGQLHIGVALPQEQTTAVASGP